MTTNDLERAMHLAKRLRELPPGTYTADQVLSTVPQLQSITHKKLRTLIYHPAINREVHREKDSYHVV